MSTSSKRLRGVVRISTQYNQPWRGFTLQRGHFYGQTESGVFFVSGLDKNDRGEIKVYLCAIDLHSDEYKWRTYWVRPNTRIAKMLLEAVPRRKALGIDKLGYKPLEKQDTGYNPLIVTSKPYPYTPMRIPCPGTGKTSYIVGGAKL